VTDPEEVDLKNTDQILVTVSDRAGQTFKPDMEESYITYVPQTIGFLPRYYRAPLLIGFGRGCPRKTKL
jgi:hypothetical protein